MSIIFGVMKSEGPAIEERQLLDLAQATDRYALDGTFVQGGSLVGMGFQPYHTDQRSNLELQPAFDHRGNMLTFDGRLDNAADLCERLGIPEYRTADSLIILSAFERWGEDCFAQLIGDWALALWSHADRTLYLARDHAGTRTLYFEQAEGRVLWSTFLETFFGGKRMPDPDEDFVACYLACQPIRNLTPYKGIRAVLPCHYVKFQDLGVSHHPHWQWMVKGEIVYRSDREYEEHFLSLFKQSVIRRTGPGAPILAHLSGGMDSTSIVCISDHIRRSEDSSAALLDTVSFYDDSEPNWNEKPYFTLVESRRGKSGFHIAGSFTERTFEAYDSAKACYLMPGADSSAIGQEQRFEDAIEGHGYRVILSGIGGDEVLGGIPTALPELADYLVSKKPSQLAQRSVEWCLAKRTPLVRLFFEVIKFTCQAYRLPQWEKRPFPSWLRPRIQKACTEAMRSDLTQRGRFGLSPKTISNGLTWWSIMESLPNLSVGFLSRYEYRLPYLDRDLVEFLSSIPRAQLIRPGNRRSLMRRSLQGIVPCEILERRRKASLIRGPIASMQQSKDRIQVLLSKSWLVDHQFVEREPLQSAFELTTKGTDTRWLQYLARTIAFEVWLKSEQAVRGWN